MPTDALPSISQMIRAHMDRTGDSQHDVSRRSRDPVLRRRVPQQLVGRVLSGNARGFPDPGTFGLWARALGTTPLAILLGFAVELRVPVDMPALAVRLPPGVDRIDPAVLDDVVALLRTLAGERRAVADEDPDDPEVDDVEVSGARDARIGHASQS